MLRAIDQKPFYEQWTLSKTSQIIQKALMGFLYFT
jgi:hypothetical protein